MSSSLEDFKAVMGRVAEGWNSGDARLAADCFAADATYLEPPDRQVYHGRDELYEFFGGDAGPEKPMSMTWHNLAFDEETQVGFGEYTFAMNNCYHGIVVVRLRDGLIESWREYQYRSELGWGEFSGERAAL